MGSLIRRGFRTLGDLFKYVSNFWISFWKETYRGTKEHKKGVTLFLGICLFILIFLAGTMYKFTETPTFCNLCHNMKVYVDSWKTSTHNFVPCAGCHYEPGFFNHLKGKWKDGQVSLVMFITGKGPTMPHAEISDASCLQKGCHRSEDLKEKMVFKNVAFDHGKHLEELRRGKKLRCTTCHAQIVQGAHLTVTETDCFICHFYKAGTLGEEDCLSCAECGACHIQPKGELSVKGISFNHKRYIERGVSCLECHVGHNKGDGHVPENKCLECHNEPNLLATKYTSEFTHRMHVTDHKIECYRCHTEIRHEVGEMPTMAKFTESCNHCHIEQMHRGPKEMYTGIGGIGVTDSPSKMFTIRVDCVGCHKTREESKAALYTTKYSERALAESCVGCHGEGYDEMLFHWKELLVKAENEVNSRIFNAQKKLYEAGKAGLEGQRFKKAQNLINEARYNYTFSLMGKGVHNIEYALKLLNHANNNMEKALTLIEDGYQLKEYKTEYTCTSLCHVGLERRTVPFNEIQFPHDVHMGMDLQCRNCHSPRENHGKTYLKNCAECHHGDGAGKVACGDCHLSVKRLFSGKTGIGVEDLPSIKVDVVECVDCHRSIAEGQKESFKAIRATCIKCHDESYGKMAEDWKSTADELLKRTSSKLKRIKEHIQRLEKRGQHTFAFTKLFGDAEYNISLVGEGKGVHNLEYAAELIEAAKKNLDQIEPMLGKKE
ncbi:MAG: cytochrome c3 family protein [Thermodesulfobacteriota bacterium]